jgi:hypothetical protein
VINDEKIDIQPNVLSDVLLTEYVFNRIENERFNLDSRWELTEKFYKSVVLYKIAIVLTILIANEIRDERFKHVRLSFEKIIYLDNNLFSRLEVGVVIDKLMELVDSNNYKYNKLNDLSNKIPCTIECLREIGITKEDQAILHNVSSVIGFGWAMAWLKEVGILETNPVELSRFSLMWMDNYIAISGYVNKYNPIN